MSNTREEPDYETRATAMKHAVELVAQSNVGGKVYFQHVGDSAVAVAQEIADYLTNGPKESK